MKKAQLYDAHERLLLEYGDGLAPLSCKSRGWVVDTALIKPPQSLVIGDQGRLDVAMALCRGQSETILCFLEFPDLKEEGRNSLRTLMDPDGGIGFNRATQKSWNLGVSTADGVVSGNFMGRYARDAKPGIILQGPFIRFYLEIISELARACADPVPAI
jgi:hypothetical protein